MKISIECEVESKTSIEDITEIEYDEKKYFFYPDDEGYINKIKIITNVPNPEKFYSEIKDSSRIEIAAEFSVNSDRELINSLIKDFQELESLLAFIYELTKIKWDQPKFSIICENDNEKRQMQIGGFGPVIIEYTEHPKSIDEKSLKNLIKVKSRANLLVAPLSFYREGILEHRSHRYINAFYNFYFVIEGLYGNKKTKNKAIEQEFKKSPQLRKSVTWYIEEHISQDSNRLQKLLEILKQKNKSLDVDGVVELIVKMRGELHHFQNNPNKLEGTPFTHNEFILIENLTMSIVIYALICELAKLGINYKYS